MDRIVARLLREITFRSNTETSVLVGKGSLVVVPADALEVTGKYTYANRLVLYGAPAFRVDRCRLVMYVRGASLAVLSPLEQLALVVDE